MHVCQFALIILIFVLSLIGVEGVVINMAKNEVTIKGIVEPQAICNKITKKTKRRAKIISPLPEAEGEPVPEVVTSHVSYGVRHAGHLPSVSSFSAMSIM